MIDQHRQRDEPVPDHLYPPSLLPGADQILTAFWELSTDRPLGFGSVGPIPSMAIHQWLDRQGIHDSDERDLVSFLIRSLDRPFMAEANKTEGKLQRKSAVELPKLTPQAFSAIFGGRGKTKVQA